MKEECGSFMAALSVNVVTVNMLLSVFFLSGVLADCGDNIHLSITAPQEMEALSGSCFLQIPCTFTVKKEKTFPNKGPIYAVWLKHSVNFRGNRSAVIYNSSKSDNTYPVKIIGNLKEKNCTTVFSNLTTTHSGKYYFRIENEPYKATADCNPVQITVKDSPEKLRIEISGGVKDLKEKESVTISCSASTPCPHSPPELTWNLQQDSHRQTEENTDGTFTTKIQQTITLSDTHDGYTITCSATYPVDGGKHVNTSETLSVSYAPKDTSASISPSGLVSAGSWVELSCSSRASPPSSFTWFKTSTEGPVKVSEKQKYTFNATDGGGYYCVAANDLGNQTSHTIHLNIKGSSDEHAALNREAVLGGITGILFLVVCVCAVICWKRTRAADLNEQQLQNKTSSERAVQELRVEPEERRGEEENLHYGEIEFSKKTPKPLSDSVQDSRQELDTLYAQVKPGFREKVDDPDSLYAEVKKK